MKAELGKTENLVDSDLRELLVRFHAGRHFGQQAIEVRPLRGCWPGREDEPDGDEKQTFRIHAAKLKRLTLPTPAPRVRAA